MRELVIPFIKAADDAAMEKRTGNIVKNSAGVKFNTLVDTHSPSELAAKMKFVLPDEGLGKDGLMEGIANIMQYSVNTWDQGFLDKLYASNNPVSLLM